MSDDKMIVIYCDDVYVSIDADVCVNVDVGILWWHWCGMDTNVDVGVNI